MAALIFPGTSRYLWPSAGFGCLLLADPLEPRLQIRDECGDEHRVPQDAQDHLNAGQGSRVRQCGAAPAYPIPVTVSTDR